MNAFLGQENVISKVRGKWFEITMDNEKVNFIISFHRLSFKTTRSKKKIFLDRSKND